MILTPNEKKILKSMKKVQDSLSCYVVLDNNYIFHSTGFYFEDIERAYTSSFKQKINIGKTDIEYALISLLDKKLIIKPSSAPIYQVTYDGWNSNYIHRVEVFHLFLESIFCPIIVSVITTLIVLLIEKIF